MYISLLSDASIDLFPDNRIGAFTCKLPHPIAVDRNKQEIGLSYISWPHKLANIEDGSFRIRISGHPNALPADSPGIPGKPSNLDALSTFNSIGGKTVGGPKTAGSGFKTSLVAPKTAELSFLGTPQETVSRRISAGYYATVQKLVASINAAIRTAKYRTSKYRKSLKAIPCEFRYDETTERVTFHSNDPENAIEYKINLSWELYIKLGYGLDRNGNSWVKDGDVTPHTSDLNLGQNSVLVYTDCIEQNRLFANSIGPLLRLVPFSGDHGKQMHFEPQRVEYCQLRTDSLSEITIEIRDDRGDVFKFLSGKVSVTLHIRDIPI